MLQRDYLISLEISKIDENRLPTKQQGHSRDPPALTRNARAAVGGAGLPTEW
jgi:hypothetical protein